MAVPMWRAAVRSTAAKESQHRITKIGIPKESIPGECRVATTPEVTKRLVGKGFDVRLEADAGVNADYPDANEVPGAMSRPLGAGMLAPRATRPTCKMVRPTLVVAETGHKALVFTDRGCSTPPTYRFGLRACRSNKVQKLDECRGSQ